MNISIDEFAQWYSGADYSIAAPTPITCTQCNIPPEVRGEEYVCPSCFRILGFAESHYAVDSHESDGCWYSKSNDPTRDIRDRVYELFISRREQRAVTLSTKMGIKYKAGSILLDQNHELLRTLPSNEVLWAVAYQFAEIRRKAWESRTTFVKCGNVRDEVLTALLINECAKHEHLNKREITEFMGLRANASHRGNTLLMEQVKLGHFAFDDFATARRYRINVLYKCTLGAYLVERYGVDSMFRAVLSARYLNLLYAILDTSLENHICVTCQLQSKIIGTIWFIMRAAHIQKTVREIEQAVRIKRGTFLKFTYVITQHRLLYAIARHYLPYLTDNTGRQ